MKNKGGLTEVVPLISCQCSVYGRKREEEERESMTTMMTTTTIMKTK